MPTDRQRQVGLLHAMPIIADDDFIDPATRKRYVDAAGTGIKRVFNKFLEGACRTFDDLPGRDLVDQRVWELPDCGHGG